MNDDSLVLPGHTRLPQHEKRAWPPWPGAFFMADQRQESFLLKRGDRLDCAMRRLLALKRTSRQPMVVLR
jgi:hypothetical protein